jgi:hypothetical protein
MVEAGFCSNDGKRSFLDRIDRINRIFGNFLMVGWYKPVDFAPVPKIQRRTPPFHSKPG